MMRMPSKRAETIGPFSRDVAITGNIFDAVAAEGSQTVNNQAMVQFLGCIPGGECGRSGGIPVSHDNPSPFDFQETSAGEVRALRLDFEDSINLTAFAYYHIGDALKGAEAGIYASSADGQNPTHLLASVAFEESSAIASHWRRAAIAGGLRLKNGTYWLAFRHRKGAWAAIVVPGKHIHVVLPSAVGSGLPTSLTSEAGQWKNYKQSGIPVVAHWEADWCGLGGTTPPSIVKNGDYGGDGHLIEKHGRYLTDGHTVYRM